jgi:hypothetical protein
MTTKQIVLAEDDQGNRLGIGPVYSAESADRLRRMVDEYGWTVLAVIPLRSLAQFTVCRRAGTGAIDAGGQS